MDVSGWLSEQLSALTDALDDPGTDLPAILDVLIDDLTTAIPSFLGLRMTLEVNDQPFTLTAIDPADAETAKASLHLPLDPLAGAGPGSAVIFYAGTAGAFADLGADARRAWGLDGQVLLDRHLSDSDRYGAPTQDLSQFSDVNRAIGTLIAEGYPPQGARIELQRRTLEWRITEPEAANRILRSVINPDEPPSADSDC